MLQTAGYGGFQPVQSYIKLHAADCIHVFPQYPWDRGWRAVVRLPTRDSGPRNTIVALFEGRSFRTCGVELATASFHYETAMKELTSWIHATQDWLLVVAPVLLSQFLALFFPHSFPACSFSVMLRIFFPSLSRRFYFLLLIFFLGAFCSFSLTIFPLVARKSRNEQPRILFIKFCVASDAFWS